jgi:L-glyceraldehyde 3-phosphate reductase
MGLEYVDIFYHHRPDPETPLAETMGALDHIVKSGKALYVGISNYDPEQTRQAAALLDELGTPCLIHQPKYNMFERWIEDELLATLDELGMGSIVFSPLAQGLLTNKYLKGIPDDSRVAKPHGFLKRDALDEVTLNKVRALNQLAGMRSQKLAQMAVAWVLRHPQVTSAVIGASSVEQIDDAVGALANLQFDDEELQAIDRILT